MNWLKKILDKIFIDGLSGMAQGLFATLIVGTIVQQIGTLVGGETGNYIFLVGKVAASLTGAGIGVGVAHRCFVIGGGRNDWRICGKSFGGKYGFGRKRYTGRAGRTSRSIYCCVHRYSGRAFDIGKDEDRYFAYPNRNNW